MYDPRLVRVIEDSYGFPVNNLTPIPWGYTNQNYHVVTEGKRYIARVSPQVKVCHLPYESHVLSQLLQSGLSFRVPQKVKARYGDFVIIDEDGRAVTLFDFIPGNLMLSSWRYPFDRDGFSRDSGAKVGELHSALAQVNTPTSEFTHEQLVQRYLSLFESYRGLKPRERWEYLLLDKIEMAIEETLKYLAYFRSPGTQKRIVHTDLRLENFIGEGERLAGILDFDDILLGDQVYDPSKVLKETYCDRDRIPEDTRDTFDVSGFRVFTKGYLAQRGLEHEQFIDGVIELLSLPALHVLFGINRDPDFDNNTRAGLVDWNLHFIELLRRRKNIEWLHSQLYG